MNALKKKKKNNRVFTNRLHGVFVLLIVIAFLLLLNLFHIQVSKGYSFREQADNQYVVATYNAFERGSIFFKEKDSTLLTAAGLTKGFKISINPSTYDGDIDELYAAVKEITYLDKEAFFRTSNNTSRTYFEIARQVDEETAQSLKETFGRDIQLHSEKWRSYPFAGAAAHSIGILGYQGDDLEGRYGLEREFEKTLRRKNTDLYTNFFARIFHNVKTLVDPNEEPEGDIITTIDPQVQIFLENELKSVHEKFDSESVGGIIIEPKTGAIKALGAFPSFDNNDFGDINLGTLRNPLIENVYEVGSIMKPLIVASAIDTNSINPKTFSYYDAGSIEVEDYTIKNFDGKGRGYVDVQEILTNSLNTGMVEIIQSMPKEKVREAVAKFGFTSKTAIDLPNEGNNITSNIASNRDIEFANISFGQGIAVTPISMVNSLSALANDGVRMKPHLVEKINYTNGLSTTTEHAELGEAFSKETSDTVTQMLVNTFDEYRNGAVRFDRHSVAAKTGTAQISNPEGGYYEDRNLHSFFGYFPAYEPEYLVYLYTVYPKNVRYASETLIDPFRNTTRFLINHYGVAPDR